MSAPQVFFWANDLYSTADDYRIWESSHHEVVTAEVYRAAIDQLQAQVATVRLEEREQCALLLDDEVAHHRRQTGGEHQYCEDYGCHYLETLAQTIRAGTTVSPLVQAASAIEQKVAAAVVETARHDAQRIRDLEQQVPAPSSPEAKKNAFIALRGTDIAALYAAALEMSEDMMRMQDGVIALQAQVAALTTANAGLTTANERYHAHVEALRAVPKPQEAT